MPAASGGLTEPRHTGGARAVSAGGAAERPLPCADAAVYWGERDGPMDSVFSDSHDGGFWMRFAKVFLAAVLVFVACGIVSGADWAQWHGPNRDAKSGETGLLKKWPEGGPKLIWSVEGIGVGYSQAAVADGTIYITGSVGNKGSCSAFDLDGKLKWKAVYGDDSGRWDGRFPGARTTPTIHDGRLYTVSANEQVSCLSIKDGSVIWHVDLRKRFGARIQQWGNAESVLIDGEKVICTPGGAEVMVAALDRKTGKTIWTTKGRKVVKGPERPTRRRRGGAGKPMSAYCSPILVERGGTRLIATMTTHHIIAVEADTGELLWEHPYRNKSGNHPVTPVYADGMFYFTSGYGLGGVMLELSDDGKKFTERWTEKRPDPTHGGVVLLDGYLYASAKSRNGKWYCVELKTGKVMWEANIVNNGTSVYADGLFYCYGDRGSFALVEMSPKGHKVISRFKITKGAKEHWAHPSISDGRLYARHGDVLMVYDIKAK